jgi:sugar lactone lactonase YvrE
MRRILPPVLGSARGARSRTELGEGAVWDAAAQRLLWVDIVKGKIFEYDPATERNTGIDCHQPVGTVVPHTDTTVVAALIKGAMVVDRATGRVLRSLGNPEADLPENRWNDGKCDPRGRLWVGSMLTSGDEPRGRGALWCLDAEGRWTCAVEGASISNGLAWSADASTFFWTDTPEGKIWAFDYDADAGSLSARRVAVDLFADGAGERGYPDGCAIDDEDNLWVAAWEGGAVHRCSTETGKILETHPVPGARLVTSCAFGGPALDQLFVTTASCGLSAEALEAQPNAGAVFQLDLSGRGVRGGRHGSSAYAGGVAPAQG